MERVLVALRALAADRYLRMVIDREPFPLYSLLTRNGFEYEAHALANRRFEIDIWRGR